MLDKFRETAITWDKATSRIYSPVTANESDENGRKLVVKIVNSGQVEDLTGATLHLYWETRDKAHDGLDVFKAVDLKKGEFELSYTTGMLSNKGVLNANLVLIDTVGRVVSERFKITVKDGIDNDAIQSENSFSSLTQALIDIANLEQNYAPRLSTLEQNDVSLSQQLQHKVGGDKKAEPEDLSARTLGLVTGTGGPINLLSIPQSKSVSIDKTTFVETGLNKFDKSKAIPTKLVNYTNGQLIDHASYFSYFLSVTPGQIVTISASFSVAYLDAEGVYVSGLATVSGSEYQPRTVTIPEGVYQLVTSSTNIDLGQNSMLDRFMIVAGSALPEYEPYYVKIDNLKNPLKKGEVDTEALAPGSVTKEKMAFTVPEAVPTKNLHNENTAVSGYYVNQTNGALDPNALHKTYEAVVVGLTHITLSKHSRSAFFDANGTFIAGSGLFQEQATPHTRTVPANAYKIKYSFPNGAGGGFQLEEGETLSPYEPYGYRLPNLILEEDSKAEHFLLLPKNLYALVGQELNIYFDNIVSGKDTDYEFDVICGKGRQFQNFWRFVPDVAENRSILINAYQKGKLVASASSSIKCVPTTAGNGVTRTILKIGDSTTDNGNGILKLNENFSTDVMDITAIGTRGTGINKHEGRSGWTATNYTTNASVFEVENAFWNPDTSKFDFNYYITSNSLPSPDVVHINLGINDMFGDTTDTDAQTAITATINKYQEMIGSIKAHNSAIKIALGSTIPPNYSQDAFGKAYNSGQTRWRYKRNRDLWVKKLIETFDNRESENIYLVPIHTNLDTRYNMGLEQTQVNTRNTATFTSPIGNGGVHPVESGYWQIADVEWYFLKSLES